MSHTLRNMSMAIALMVSASPLLMSTQAYALSSHDCSVAFKAAKAAGTDGGLKYKDYRAANCAADAAAPAAPAAAAPVAKVAAPAAKVAAPAAPAATAAVATTASGSFMKDCSDAWKASKANNTRPAGLTWKEFVAAKCVFPGAAAAPVAPVTKAMAPAGKTTPVVIAPAEPAGAADATPLATADKNGKAFTPGQMAAHKRIRECGSQWRALKAANKVPVGTKWPQFWSSCNKQLKAAGQ